MSQRISSSATDHLGRGYPRPQLRRDGWVSLNGSWDFAFDPSGTWRSPSHVQWDRSVRVPFAPEAPASGLGVTSFFRACWYRRTIPVPRLGDGERLLLHFGAVDYEATVWAGGVPVGHHVGGYTPFTIDLTPCAPGTEELEIVVRVEDDPQDLAKPRGKQDWQLEPHSIWYPRTTGIWQTVWIEVVPDTWIGTVRWTPNLERWEIALEARVFGARRDPLRLHVRLRCGSQMHCRRQLRGRRRRGAPADRALRSRASTTTATSCCGARSRRRSSMSRCGSGASAVNCSTRSPATPRCAPSARRASASSSTIAPTRCGWCSIRATGPRAG